MVYPSSMTVEAWSQWHRGCREYQPFPHVLYLLCLCHHSYGIHFFTKSFSDGKLFQVAHAFEKLTAVREKGPLPFRYPTTDSRDILKGTQRL